MNPAWTETDKMATLIARDNFLRHDPKEREPFEVYVNRAYEYVREKQAELPLFNKRVLH